MPADKLVDYLWFTDLVAPAGDVRAIVRDIQNNIFRMPAAKAVCLDLVISSKSMAYVMHYSDFPH
ncbi:hypothetical protein C8J34_11840 [Rhizobium sp. PP-F2F-G36]|nr:hypothetical protein C8J34_11840 [Rhizobium sp. PP-F2F-G36]